MKNSHNILNGDVEFLRKQSDIFRRAVADQLLVLCLESNAKSPLLNAEEYPIHSDAAGEYLEGMNHADFLFAVEKLKNDKKFKGEQFGRLERDSVNLIEATSDQLMFELLKRMDEFSLNVGKRNIVNSIKSYLVERLNVQ